jgi:aminopeptidase
MNDEYTPPQKILERYADVLINFALGGGKGIKRGDVVRLTCSESSKPLFIELKKAILKAGGHPLTNYLPDNERTLNPARVFFENANKKQLSYFPKTYYKALIEEIDHSVFIISERNKKALEGIDPRKIILSNESAKPFKEWREKKENAGKFTWTLALYGTREMATEAGLSIEEYWGQIIDACYLNNNEPVKKWREVSKATATVRKKLNALNIKKLHIKGEDADLIVEIGQHRKWAGGNGRNIPSFEIFTSPDWRGTEGWIRFNQPLYRYGSLIQGIELHFNKGIITKAKASNNEKLLKEMISAPNANKLGEVSLTDGRHSKITKFMAETLFDENMGGPEGNVHIAIGNSYHDCYDGDPDKVTKVSWQKMGFNDSMIHTDMISTTRRTVTATLSNGKEIIIYKKGRFVI